MLAGEKAGSKLEKAAKLGVAVIDEDEFIRRLEEEDKGGEADLPSGDDLQMTML